MQKNELALRPVLRTDDVWRKLSFGYFTEALARSRAMRRVARLCAYLLDGHFSALSAVYLLYAQLSALVCLLPFEAYAPYRLLALALSVHWARKGLRSVRL